MIRICHKLLYFFISASFILASLPVQAQNNKATTETSSQEFVYPTIPAELRDIAERKKFLISHYWDHFDFSSNNKSRKSQASEQALVNYIDLLSAEDSSFANKNINALLNLAQTDPISYDFFTSKLEFYLWGIHSPLYNEELFIPVLEHMLASKLDEQKKTQPRYLRERALKNRQGTPATDFSYTLYSGQQENLYDIDAEYTILMLYDPTCGSCGTTIDKLKIAHKIDDMLRNGMGNGKSLAFLAVSIDNNVSAWEKYREKIPMEWINGYDTQLAIKEQDLYDLRAIPPLYLLDKNKKVILKNASVDAIEEELVKRQK